jgi:TolB protein
LLTIGWLDCEGRKQALPAAPGYYADPRISPDGKRLALMITQERSHDVWVYDLQRSAMTRLTFGEGVFADPIWSPDGRYLVFGSFSKGIYGARADGTGLPQLLIPSKFLPIPFSVAPDGKTLGITWSPGPRKSGHFRCSLRARS